MSGRPTRDSPAKRPSAARWIVTVFLTLRGRLILLVCFATVPAILFIFFVAAKERESALARMETEARHLGGLASREHAHQLEGGRNLLRRLAAASACDGRPDAAAPTCPDYLPALLSGFPQFANIGLASPQGDVLCSAAPIPHPASLKTNAAFERAVGSSDVETGTYVLGFVGRPVLHMALAVRDENQAPCGVVFVAVELGWLDQLAEQANLPADYSLLITDRVAHVLARSGAAARDLIAEQGRSVPALAEALTRSRGAILEIGAPPSSRYFVATPMEGMPGIFVIAGLPHERVQATANRAFTRTLLGLAVVTVFAILSAIFAAELSILRVLRALTRAVRRFGAGDLSARAPIPESHSELRELALSFSAMADALAVRQKEAREAQERLRALSHHLQTVRDEEAGRIARELHDELGQILTGLKMELTAVRRACNNDNPAAAAQAIIEMSKQIDHAIDSVRRISSELRPPVLDRLGLAAALDWLARDCEAKAGPAVVINVRDLEEPLDSLVSTTVFRVVQEALTNVVRHADATEVTVDLIGRGETLALTVHDNGRGIGEKAAKGPKSLGIFGMRERARLVGGSFRIEGGPGKGTTITCVVPRRPPDVTAAIHEQEP
ncbi:MAG: HAMP domain-containing protein [Polyangiaceae bacterium]|nr:histidine kinase [Polyangiaceae bacterium]NUQ74103.1 HAMP domain-containing protein [Polyangiaceae bacterium]